MPEIATETMTPDQMPPFAMTIDGKVFLNGKLLTSPVRPKGETLAILNDIIILLATACSSVLVVKKTVDQILDQGTK